MSVSIDASEMRQFGSELTQGVTRLPSKVRPVIERGALNMKNDLIGEASRSRHFRIGRHINYDITAGNQSVEAEIGPEKVGAGNLALFAYFGGANGGGGTIPDPQGALDRETPNIERYLADVIEDLF